MADAPLVLALDIGTSSVRALLYDAHARPLPDAAVHIKHAPRATPDGGLTFDAAALFARCLDALDALHARAAGLHLSITAVASDSFVSNLLALDARGEPLTPVYTYADTRAAVMVPRLRAALDEQQTYQRVGVPFHSAYWHAQLLWLRETQRATFDAAARWCTFGDYFLWKLFGVSACSYSAASWTGLLDRVRLQWDEPLLRALGLDAARLPTLVHGTFHCAGLPSPWAARWPLLADARWFATVGDGAAANIGSGCYDATRAALTIGTTAAVRVVLHETPHAVPRGLWCYRVDERRALLGGALSEGGNVVAWLRDLLGASAPDDAALAALAPDAHGLTLLPLIAGERSPGWRAEARGVWTGLALTSGPAALMRAALEAVALRLGAIWQRLAPHVPQVQTLVGSGGGLLASPLWMQIVADTLVQPLMVSDEPEATSRGAALLALEAMGVRALDAFGYEAHTRYVPNAAHHAIYTRALQRQQALYDAIYQF